MLEPRPTDINACLSGMTELMRRTIGEAVEIETVLAGGLWHAMVDPSQLENAVLNLAINARDAMPNGGVLRISARQFQWKDPRAPNHKDLNPGPYVAIEVSDTGSGIPQTNLDRVFEPFFTTKPVGVGTGLGLSVAYFIVSEQHRGSLSVQSTPQRGSCFTVLLPLLREHSP